MLPEVAIPDDEDFSCSACRRIIQVFSGRTICEEETLILLDKGNPDILCTVSDVPRLLSYGFGLDQRKSG